MESWKRLILHHPFKEFLEIVKDVFHFYLNMVSICLMFNISNCFGNILWMFLIQPSSLTPQHPSENREVLISGSSSSCRSSNVPMETSCQHGQHNPGACWGFLSVLLLLFPYMCVCVCVCQLNYLLDFTSRHFLKTYTHTSMPIRNP